MIVFLDFDGVLHPNGPLGQLFEAVPRLGVWLARWPAYWNSWGRLSDHLHRNRRTR